MHSDIPRRRRSEPEFAARFFVLRTPLYPWDEFLEWSSELQAPAAREPAELAERLLMDRQRLVERLRAIFLRPEAREALFVASPSLEEGFREWMDQPQGPRTEKVSHALVRYFARMSGRATPFGLFAGHATGTLGPRTRLTVGGMDSCRRHTRLDMYYLSALTERLLREPALRSRLLFRPNSSLYRVAGRIRLVEGQTLSRGRSFSLVALEQTPYLDAVLARAATGARVEELAATLTEAEPEVTEPEALEFIHELIDAQVLVAELEPLVTGPEPLQHLTSSLREHGLDTVSRCLEEAQADLAAIDAAPLGVEPGRYLAVANGLSRLPTSVEPRLLFQVDLRKSHSPPVLGQPVLSELLGGVELLRRLFAVRGEEALARFREAFLKRYETREVPLLEVLDEETGIGFERSRGPGAEVSPLLQGLAFPSRPEEPSVSWGPLRMFLHRKLLEVARRGEQELVLEPAELERFYLEDPVPLPDAFAAMATLIAPSSEAIDQGDYRLLLETALGPSGAVMLGRFCHGDETLHRLVKEHLRAEEALHPEALFAEIVHLPQGRTGNVICRPVLREHEVAFLGGSGAPREKQIPLEDLLVSVVGGRIVLRSRKLRREVLPRLTNAHFYSRSTVGIYRFLCALCRQGGAGSLRWSWGPFDATEFLPRVVVGRTVLSRAMWNLGPRRLRPLKELRGADVYSAVQRLRAELSLPRYVLLAEGDNQLPLDLDNVLCVETLVKQIRNEERARLVEFYPSGEELCAQGSAGRFVHELIIPFVRTREPAKIQLKRRVVERAVERSFVPGSEWLYLKLYTGLAGADELLRQLGPVIREQLAAANFDRWFFLRFSDPDFHLRLRFHGSPERLWDVYRAVHAHLLPSVENGLLWRVGLDTYEREVERYGGAEGIELAERLFCADSEAVLRVIEGLEGNEGHDARWRLTLFGMDALLADLGLELAERKALVEQARVDLRYELHIDKPFEIQLGDRFRQERKPLEALLFDPDSGARSELSHGIGSLRQRGGALAAIAAELRSLERTGSLGVPMRTLARWYLHMHANRFLRGAPLPQEFILYDFLFRLYDSRLARARGRGR